MKSDKFNLLQLISILLIICLISGCSSSVRYANLKSRNTPKQASVTNFYTGQIISGEASYYGPKFHGRQTANGETFDMYKKTAAHKELPFETLVRVTNLQNKKSVVVRINDRGPFAGDRILDLSYQAARDIDMISTGVAKVKIEIVRLGEE